MIKKKESFFYIRPLKPTELKESILKLGASFIKLAQVLATRSDFFSEEYINELVSLHDKLPPMNESEFKKVYDNSFQSDIFKSFEKEPIASASIGEVHVAYLKDGTKVAVKLRRYGIEKRVKADILIITAFNAIFKPLFSQYTKNSIEAVIKEFSKMILQEIDFLHELRNLEKFREVYKDLEIRFPTPYKLYSSKEALVMSFEEGFRFDDKKSLIKYNIDFKDIIKKLVDFYTAQMLLNGFFHADPHPGNILVNKDGELIFLDFGMVKNIPNSIRIAIIELIKAANERDFELYISANKRLGTIAYEAPVAEVAEFTERMFEIFEDNALDSKSMQKLAFEILEQSRDLPFKLPSDAIYILRVSAIIEGLGTTYIENFNGIKDILPILQKNVPKALGLKDSITQTLKNEIKELPFLYNDLKHSLKKINDDSLIVEISNNQLEWIAKEIKSEVKFYILHVVTSFIGLALVFMDKGYENIGIALIIYSIFKIIYK